MKNRTSALIGGLGIGAGLMYLLDPDAGARRRALLRDQALCAWHKTGEALGKTGRDLGHRASGIGARARGVFRHDEAGDDVLEARIRSKLGRHVSHPHAIEVEAMDGRITLRGPILAREEAGLIACVSGVRGVDSVDNQLERHASAEGVPSLQGGAGRPGTRPEFMQSQWSPAARMAGAAAGTALLVSGFMRRGPAGALMGVAGAGLLARSATNLGFRRMTGIGAGRRGIELRKTLHIEAPPEKVFEFWNHYQSFPLFMSHVREVRDLGGDRSHWVIEGPAGIPVEFDSVVTRRVPGRLLAWRSEPGSIVQHAGGVRFEARERGCDIDVQFAYNPPAGVLGHGVATIFGADPKHAMDEDLLRMKSLLEEGRTSSPKTGEAAPETSGAVRRGRGTARATTT